MILPLFLSFALCPPHAVSAGAALYTQIIPANPVVGQPVQIQSYVYWLPLSIWGDNAAVGGGSCRIAVGQQVLDVTPTNGIPLMGDTPCADKWFCPLATQTVVFTNAGPTLLLAQYLGYADVYPLLVSHVRLIEVRDTKIRYDNGLVWWFGYGSYTLEASEDLQTWSPVATLSGRDGFYEFQDEGGEGKRFWRHKRI